MFDYFNRLPMAVRAPTLGLLILITISLGGLGFTLLAHALPGVFVLLLLWALATLVGWAILDEQDDHWRDGA